MSEHIMDDWKLKIRPVVRLEKPTKRFVDFIIFTCASCILQSIISRSVSQSKTHIYSVICHKQCQITPMPFNGSPRVLCSYMTSCPANDRSWLMIICISSAGLGTLQTWHFCLCSRLSIFLMLLLASVSRLTWGTCIHWPHHAAQWSLFSLPAAVTLHRTNTDYWHQYCRWYW